MLFVNYYKDSSSNVAEKTYFSGMQVILVCFRMLQFCIFKALCFVFVLNRRNKTEESQTGSI